MEEGDPKALLPWGSLYVLRNSLHTPPEKKKWLSGKATC